MRIKWFGVACVVMAGVLIFSSVATAASAPGSVSCLGRQAAGSGKALRAETRASAYPGWRARADVGEAPGLPPLETLAWGDPTLFTRWMEDRDYVAALRRKMAAIFGPAQGESPLRDLVQLRRIGLRAEDIVAPPEPDTAPY